MRWLLPALLALSVVFPVQAATLPSACGLLTNAEVQKAFGAKIASRTNRDYDNHLRSCMWISVPLGSFTSATSQLLVMIRPMTKAQFTQAAKQSQGAFPVRGIGEAAFGTPPGNSQSLSVRQRGFGLNFSFAGGSSPLQAEKTLAKHALTRL